MADIKTLYDLCDKVSDELSEANKKLEKSDKMSAGDLEYLDKLTHMMKSIKTVIAMEESGNYSNDGYSGRYHDGDMSYGRKRDSMGRYSSRRGYSRSDAREDMIAELHELMNEAPDDHTRQKFKRFINEMEND